MSNLALRASTGELPVDLVALREEVLAAGGAIGNDMLRQLLAQGPSWAMAGVLDAIDPDRVAPVEFDLPDPDAVSDHAMQVAVREGADAGRLILLQLWKRQEAWTASRSMTSSHAYATSAMDRTGRETSRFDVSRSGVVAEVGLVMGVHGSTADVKITQAGLLNPEGVLSTTHEALAQGLITEPVARLMADAMDGLSFEQMARVEAMVLPRLVRHIDPVTREGAPAGYSYAKDQLARALNRIAPERAKEKHARAMAKRGVKIRILEEDGLAQICLWTTKVQGISFYERINEMAEASQAAERKAVEDSGHDASGVRTINQARADVLVKLVLNAGNTTSNGKDQQGQATHETATTVIGCGNSSARVSVGLLIDLPTILALRDNPAELPGYGPLDPELARALAADNEWRRFLHDPITGQILDLGHTKYEPNKRLREFIHARDPKCTYPGCNHQARRSQLDHITPWPQGPTDRDNLHPLCVHHHNLKTHGNWQVTRDHDSGETTWTSPRGLTAKAPHPYQPMPKTIWPDEDDGPPPF
ncbi:unannotated protein [freshwater metagenome]|uniref:Unannotated protein n=1 Tax=freshwater metagenome TaxID=449393 RepID=A0A6J7GTQ5_9ZZZZ